MKRLLCCILCLAALAASFSSGAAEAAPTASFAESAAAFFRSFDPDRESLRLSIEPPEGGPLSVALTLRDGLLTLNADLPDGPAALQIGSEAAWLSANGAVYELRYADFAKQPALLNEDDLQAWRGIAMLFGARILLPGITAEQNEEALTVHLSYDAETLVPALAEFGDSVVGSERYLGAVLTVLNAYARSAGQEALTADAVRAAWPEAREMLLALPKDASLTGDMTASGESIDGKIALSASGSAYTLTFSGKDSEGRAEFSAALAVPQGEAAHLQFLLDRPGGAFEAAAALPFQRREASVKGSVCGGILAGEAEITSGAVSLVGARLSASRTGSGHLVILPKSSRILGGQAAVIDFDFMPGLYRAALSSGGHSALIKWSQSPGGVFSGALEWPNPLFSASLSGQMQRGSLRMEGSVRSARAGSANLTLDYSLPERRFSLDGAYMGNKGSLTLTWDRSGCFNAAAGVSVMSSHGAIPISAKVNGFQRPGAFFADCDLNYRGARVSGSVSASGTGKAFSVLATLNQARGRSTAALQLSGKESALNFGLYAGQGSFTAVFEKGGKLEIRQQSRADRPEYRITGGFDGEGDYLLDYATISRPVGLPLRAAESHMLLRASTGDGEQLSLTLTERFLRHSADGAVEREQAPVQRFSAVLSRIPAEPAVPLTGQETVRLTPELLMQLFKESL